MWAAGTLLVASVLGLGFGREVRGAELAVNASVLCMAWGCECTERNVDCSNSDVGSLNGTVDWPRELAIGTRLVLSRNALVDIPSGTFSSELLAGVHGLDLSYNALTTIADDALASLPELRHLQLEYNHLRTLTARTLAGLAKLERLDVSYNRLGNLSADAFSDCHALHHLVLRYNPLLELDPGLLLPLRGLEILDLNNVGLTRLDADAFANLSSLVELNLAQNQLDEVPTDALHPLRELVRLDFSDNGVASVPAHAFDGLYNLELLKLDNMEHLESIDAYAFHELYNLQVVECSFNRRLRYVHADAFRSADAQEGEYTGRVRELRLRQNALATLDRRLLPWMRVDTVDLQENPWHCDCHLQWMKFIVAQKDPSGHEVRCHTPSSLSGRRVDQVGAVEFECAEQSEHALLSLALFLVALVAVVGAVGGVGCWKLRACAKCREAYQQRYKKLGTSAGHESGVEMDCPRNDTRDVEV